MSSSRAFATALFCKNPIVSLGLRHLLSDTCFAVAEESFHEAVSPDAAPDLFILDGSTGSLEVMDAIGALREHHPRAKIVVIGDKVDLDTIKRGLAAGLDGFCLTSSGREVLIKSLEMVMLGETVLPSALVCSVLTSSSARSEPLLRTHAARADASDMDPRAHKLSMREAEILECLMEGAPNKVIARKFDVAEATVKVHVKAILRKIGAANRTQAAIWATEHLPAKVETRLVG